MSLDLLYGLFTDFVCETVKTELTFDFNQKINKLPFNFNMLEQEEKDDFIRSRQNALKDNLKAISCKTSKERFWNATKLIFCDVVMQPDKVTCTLSSHFAMLRCLQRFARRSEISTFVCREKLSVARSAYENPSHHHFHIMITPNSKTQPTLEKFVLCYTNLLTDKPRDELFIEMKDMRAFHPVFEMPCYFQLLFLCAVLAQMKKLYVHIKFDAGVYFQYLTIFDDAFEVIDIEDGDTSGTKTGCHTLKMSYFNTLDNSEFKFWQHEVFVRNFVTYNLKNETLTFFLGTGRHQSV